MKKWEVIETFQLGGKGSGHHGHQGGTGGKGKPGGSRAMGQALLDGLNLSFGDRIMVEGILKKVPPQQLAGLQGITTDAPEQFPDWRVPAKLSPTGKAMRAGAAYDHETNTVHINLKNPLWGTSFVHELGHHVVSNSSWRESPKAVDPLNLLHVKHREARNLNGAQLHKMGLKKHSVANALEFQAETWRMYLLHKNTSEARNLSGFLGVSNLDGIFGA